MMKKVLMLLCYTLIVGTVHARVGVGATWSGTQAWRTWSADWNVGVNVAQGDNERVNWDLSVRFWHAEGFFSTSLDFSTYFLELPLFKIFILYVGMGSYLDFFYNDSGINPRYEIDIGLRAPVGLRLLLDRSVDLWFAMASSLGMFTSFTSTFEEDKFIFDLGGGIGVEAGIRFWF